MSEPETGLPHTTLRGVEPRALKKFGGRTGKQVRSELVRRVWAGDVLYARKLTRSLTVIVLIYAGEEVAFMYSKPSKRIVSFLPSGAPETGDWRRSQAAARALFPPAEGSY